MGYKRIVLKSDKEPSIVAFCDAVKNGWHGEFVPPQSPRTFQKTNSDFTTKPDFVINKNSHRGSKHGVCERQVRGETDAYESKTKETWAAIRRSFQGGSNKKDTEGHWRSTYCRKRNHVFLIASLFKYTTLQLRKVKRLQNDKHWILRLKVEGPQKSLRQRPKFVVAVKQCL